MRMGGLMATARARYGALRYYFPCFPEPMELGLTYCDPGAAASPPDDPAKTRRPSGRFTEVALQVREPSLDNVPSMLTWSPSLKASLVQPLRVRVLGGPPSHCQRALAPDSSLTSR